MRNHRKRKPRGKALKKQKKIIILSMIGTMLLLSTGYAAFQTVISINTKGNIKELSKTIQNWEKNSNTDFHNEEYRENIVSATFLDTNKVPNDAVASWKIADDKKSGVMAYITINQDDYTKYDLFIGADGGVIANEDSSYLFFNFTNLKEINFGKNFNTSNVINMQAMFASTGLYELDLSSFVTNNVTDMSYLFGSSQNLKKVNLSSFNTSKVTTMTAMFHICTNLEELDISHFDTSNVIGMYAMFQGCQKLTELNITNFDTSKIKSMGEMFSNCRNITTLDLSSFDTSSLTDTWAMFYHNVSLTTIYVSEKFVTTNIISSSAMFNADTKLVGGNGTKYDVTYNDATYARIDTEEEPGYFTLKTN